MIFYITAPQVYSNSEYTGLYQVKYKNHRLFLNKKVDVIIKISASKFDDVGNFTNGRVFLAKDLFMN